MKKFNPTQMKLVEKIIPNNLKKGKLCNSNKRP